MESAHEPFLLTSCDALKKRTSERSERISFCMYRNELIKIVQALFMVLCFYFIHTEIFPHCPTHFKTWTQFFCPPRRSTIVCVSNWTNDVDVFSQSFAQYV